MEKKKGMRAADEHQQRQTKTNRVVQASIGIDQYPCDRMPISVKKRRENH
jgi:DNA-directed RNA polymerase subunit N (RpoN/RPB10)